MNQLLSFTKKFVSINILAHTPPAAAPAALHLKKLYRWMGMVLLLLAAHAANAQVTASFTVDDTAGCVPITVNFTNTSSGATSYSWDLGNGTTSGFADVTGTYVAAGTYTVTLVATSGTNSSRATAVIHVYAAPTVSFSASDTSVCPGTPVSFSSSTIAGAPGSLSYNWYFGDGFSSTATAPVHAYVTPGYYNVSLFATNSEGCESSLAKPGYVHVLSPTALSFTAPTSSFCRAPAAVSFVNTSSGFTPVTYNWTFGDGGSIIATSPTHTYLSPGSYTVQLSATDGHGCKDTLIVPNFVTVGNLHASFTPVPSSCGGAPVSFSNTSSTHISSQWFFGDGSSMVGETGVHTYYSNGSFTVTLVVFDGACYDTVSHPIAISYPTGSFSITPAIPCPTSYVQTFAATTAPANTVSWIFDGGTTGSGNTVTHNYGPVSSIYSTSMILVNPAGCRDTLIKLDTLYNLDINPTGSPNKGCVPLPVSFTCYAYSFVFDPFTFHSLPFTYPAAITSYSWNFGDGSPTSTAASPTHTYTAVGEFTSSCTITTANGCTVNNTGGIKVGTTETPSFTLSSRHVCAGQTVNYVSTSTSALLIDSYDWDFGDGTPDDVGMYTADTHVYSVAGVYPVALSVSYLGCDSHPFVVNDTVDSPGATMALVYDCTPNNGITFYDTANHDDSHTWIFGDGTTSTVYNLNHLYPSLTSYTVKLATYNSSTHCRDTSSMAVNLTPTNVVFLPFDSLLCKGQSDTISISPVTSTMYNWYDNGTLISTAPGTIMDTFRTAGIHSVFLVVKDTHGCYDTSRVSHIIAASPVDSFSFSPPGGCAPLPVTFTDHTTDVAGVSISNYQWRFGDGASALGLGPSILHTYTANGTYSATEIVTDNLGCMDSVTSRLHPTVHTPVASFSVTATSVCAGTSVHFVNTSPGIAGSLWLFGDGTTSTVTSPLHAYSVPGTYTVKLVVYDLYSCASDTLIMPGLITVLFAPSAAFGVSDSVAICGPLHVNFFNTTTGAVSYLWFFGDGATSVADSPSNVYIDSGLFVATLVATSGNGCTDTARQNISLFGYAGAFTYTPVSGCTPLTAHFVADLAHARSAVWDFSDGITSGALTDTVSHTYIAPGNYLPKLILTDSTGCSKASWGADTIRVDSVIPRFTVVPNPVCQNTALTLLDHSSSAGYFAMTHWLWTFGTGAASSSSAPTYTYTVAGVQTITLYVTDSAGCTGTVSHTVTVNPLPPAITGPTNLCNGSSFTYTDGSPGGLWSSSNNSVASIGSSTGTATAITTGTVTFTYTSTSGCSVTRTVVVIAAPASIIGAGGMCIGNLVHYTDSTSGGTWSVTPGSIASVSTSGAVSGIASGIAALSYTAGACSAVRYVTVSTTPGSISGPSVVCAGSTISLGDSIPGGAWSVSGSAASVGTSGVVLGVSAGAAVISYSLGTGCYRVTTVNVNPGPVISGPGGVCVTGIIPLTSSLTGGTWSSSNTSVATVGTSGIVTGIDTGTATISYVLPSGCFSGVPVTVHGRPSNIAGLFRVCLNDTTTLSDTTGGGIWSAASPSIATIGSLSGLVTGVTAGSTVITYSLGSTGCQKTQAVTVNPLPLAISGSGSVCPGGAVTLTDGTGGGSWSGGGPVATIGSSSGIVTAVSAGVAALSYTLATTGCRMVKNVTVNPLPAAIAGSGTLCLSLTTLLTDSLTGGSWSSSNPSVASISAASGLLTGVDTGTARITYTLPTGCSITALETISSRIDTITGRTSLCSGSSITLADGLAGGTWASSNGAVATVGSSTGVVTGIASGTAVISYSLGSGCGTTKTVTVVAEPGPIAGTLLLCSGATDTLTESPAGGIWSATSAAIAVVGSGNGALTGIAGGMTNITYTLGPGCQAVATATVLPAPAGITGRPYVCLGATETLTDAMPGSWSSTAAAVAPITSGGVVSGLSGGPAVISYTGSNGCAATLTFSVIAVPPITGLHNICAWGDTLLVFDSALTGIYTSALVTVVTRTGGYGLVYAHAPGVATIQFNMPEGCSWGSTLIVNPLPGAITGNLHVCTGTTTSLSDSLSGGVWSCSGGTLAAIDSFTGIVSGHSIGSVMVSYTFPTGCFTDTLVHVLAPPSAVSGTATLCAGSTAPFTDSVAGGTWSSSALGIATVSSAGLVSGISAGVATISYATGAICSVGRMVTINPMPLPYAITGGASYCAGSPAPELLLTGSQAGVSYQLFDGVSPVDSPVSGTGALLDFGPQATAGTYTIRAVAATTLCAANMVGTAVVSVTASPSVFAVSGGGSYCAGGAGVHITLPSSQPGISYQVYRGGVPTAALVAGTGGGLDFGLFTATGNYTVKAASTATGCSSWMADSVAITIIPTVAPAISVAVTPGDTVCAGSFVSLVATDTNGGPSPVFKWSVNGSPASSSSSFAYVPSVGDIVTALLTSDAPCALPDTTSATVALTVTPLLTPVVAISAYPGTTVAHGAGDTLVASATGAGASPLYQWYVDGALIPGATTDTFVSSSFVNLDSVRCMVTSTGACGGYSGGNSVTITVTTVGVPELARQGSVTIQPNPSRGIFQVSGILDAVSGNTVVLECMDMPGRTVFRKSAEAVAGRFHTTVDLGSDVAAGVYLLKVVTGSRSEVFRIVVDK